MKFFVVTFLFILSSQTAQAKIKVDVNYSPLANLVYQLDCISGHLHHCSKANYQKLWDDKIAVSKIDKKMVTSWGKLMELYKPELELAKSGTRAVTGRFEGVKLATKIRIASFQSDNLNQYLEKLDLVTLPSDKGKIVAILKHFDPKFQKWWKKSAQSKGSTFIKSSKKLLKSKKITEKLNQFFDFYQVDLPDGYEVTFNFFYRPDIVKEPTSGQQIENYSTTEFLPKEKASERLDVVIHELCHFFLENSDQDRFAIFQKQFIDLKDLSAMSAYNLMNESLATVFGNGMINRIYKNDKSWAEYKEKPQSFYNNYHIDKAAKALLPLLDQHLKHKKTIYSKGFVGEYVSELKKAFGDELSAPRLLLTEMVLLGDSKFGGPFRNHVRKEARVSSMYTSEGSWSDKRFLETYERHKDLNVLLIVHPDNLDNIKKYKLLPAKVFKAIKASYKTNKSVTYAYNKSPSTVFYVISAKNYDSSLKLVTNLASLKKGFEGILDF